MLPGGSGPRLHSCREGPALGVLGSPGVTGFQEPLCRTSPQGKRHWVMSVCYWPTVCPAAPGLPEVCAGVGAGPGQLRPVLALPSLVSQTRALPSPSLPVLIGT